jgi:hypothetical protein
MQEFEDWLEVVDESCANKQPTQEAVYPDFHRFNA